MPQNPTLTARFGKGKPEYSTLGTWAEIESRLLLGSLRTEVESLLATSQEIGYSPILTKRFLHLRETIDSAKEAIDLLDIPMQIIAYKLFYEDP